MHAEQREQRQHERLAAEQAARREVAARIEQHQRHGDEARECAGSRPACRRRPCRDNALIDVERAASSASTQVATQQRELRQPVAHVAPRRPARTGRPAGSAHAAARTTISGRRGQVVDVHGEHRPFTACCARRRASRSATDDVHHVDEGLGPDAHAQHRRRDARRAARTRGGSMSVSVGDVARWRPRRRSRACTSTACRRRRGSA